MWHLKVKRENRTSSEPVYDVLQVYPDASITIKDQSPLFFDPEDLMLTFLYTFPLSVPMTQYNKRLLQYPNRIDEADHQGEEHLIELETQLWVAGQPWKHGRIYITDADDDEARLHFESGRITDFKKFKITEVDYGDPFDLMESVSFPTETMFDTLVNPDDYDYIFCKVNNIGFWRSSRDFPDPDFGHLPGDPEESTRINSIGLLADGDLLNSPEGAPVLIPFFRWKFIIEKIFEHEGISLEADLYDLYNEYKNIYLYNNISISYVQWAGFITTYVSDTIEVKYHVLDQKASDTLKEWLFLFNQYITYNPNTQKAHVKLKDSVIKSNDKVDLTEYAHYKPQRTKGRDRFRTVSYEIDQNDRQHVAIENETDYNIVQTIDPSDLVPLHGPGEYVDVNEKSNYYVLGKKDDGNGNITETMIKVPGLKFYERELNTEIGENVAFTPAPLFVLNDGAEYGDNLNQRNVDIDAPGWFFFWEGPPAEIVDFNPSIAEKNFNPRLIFYRGIHNTESSGGDRPIHYPGTEFDGTTVGEQSLLWTGPNGLLENFWGNWLEFLETAKTVKQSFLLPAQKLLNFDWETKIQVGNQLYLARDFTVTITPDGIEPAEFTLKSIHKTNIK